MRTFWKPLNVAVSVTLGACLLLAPTLKAEEAKTLSAVDEGKELAFEVKKGNCLACHQIEGGDASGNIGPPLLMMKQRFPDKAKLRAQIYDATVANPNSMMPPFGRHGALSDAEIDKIAEFIYTL
jgi:sulfur-oxidizing protein SoxX